MPLYFETVWNDSLYCIYQHFEEFSFKGLKQWGFHHFLWEPALQPNSFHHLERFPECLLTLNFLLIVYPLFLLKGNLPKVSVV